MDARKRIFISHSHNDSELAHLLAELITKSINISPEEIMNTSNTATNLAPGATINKDLLRLAREADIFLCLYTEKSKSSRYMLYEIGARLSGNDKIYTLVKQNNITRNLPEILSFQQATVLANKNDIFKLVDEIAEDLSVELNRTYLYAEIVDSIANMARVITPNLNEIIKQNTLGLKTGVRNDNIFQNFKIGGKNLDPIQYYWSQSTNGSMIYITYNPDEYFITANYINEGQYGCNFSVRPQDQMAVAKGHNKYITFEARLSSGEEEKASLGIRLVNGYMQHWQYSTGNVGEFMPIEVTSDQWDTFKVDLETASDWKLFESDGVGNRLKVLEPDFSIICLINFSLGGIDSKAHIMTQGNHGKGKVDFRNIMLAAD